MVSFSCLRGRAPLCLLSIALASAGLIGCESSGGDDGPGSSSSSEGSTTDPTTTGSTDPGTTSSETGSSSETTDASTTGSTTTVEGSSSSGEGSSSTGELCDPGTQNCVCDGGTCEGDLECVDDVCYTPGGCQGKQLDMEPNQDEAAAQVLPGITCGQLSEVEGSSEPADVDWYTTKLDDLGKDCPNSDGTIAIVTADEDLEVCMYFACDAGAASVNCGPDDQDTSPDGLAGCCGTNSVEPNFFCSGVNSDSEVRIRVGGLQANACVDYAVAYRVL